jgi:hypothetical protein
MTQRAIAHMRRACYEERIPQQPTTEDLRTNSVRYSDRSTLLPKPLRDAPYTLFSVGGGATNLTTCCSRSGWNGLAMQTTAPS